MIRLLIGLVVASGCGPGVSSMTAAHGGQEVTVSGARVVTLRRPTTGLLHLSLWIDAGSRDADVPQIATVAAWLAGNRAGEGADGRALADGIVVELLCERRELAACTQRLGRALGTRDFTDAELAQLRGRLVAVRRRAATDEARTADALALHALLGADGAALVPLGVADDDDAVDRSALTTFLEAHFGPSRAMVVGAGDIQPEDLANALEPVFDALEPATGTRRASGLVVREARAIAQIGESHHVTAAVVRPTLPEATAVATRLDRSGALSRLAPEQAPELRVHAFEVRGGAIVLARASSAEPVSTTRALVSALSSAVAEAEPLDPTLRPDSPERAARAVGYEWLSRGEDTSGVSSDVSVGVIAAGGRGDDAEEHSDDDQAARLTRQIETARIEALALAQPRLTGHRDGNTVKLRTDNGATVVIQRRETDQRVAVVVRFAGGADLDPASLHGRVAVVARLVEDECQAPATVTVSSWVASDAWGVSAVAARQHYGDAIDAAIRCGAIATVDPLAVESARVQLLALVDSRRRAAAWAGQLLAPQSPGTVAPGGDPEQLRHVTVESVRRLARASRVGRRVVIAAVGDVPMDDTAQRIARRVADWPTGEPQPPTQPGDAAAEMLARSWSGPGPRVVIGWRAAGDDEAAARAFAASVGLMLDTRPGLTLVDAVGGRAPWGVWAYVVVDATERALPGLPTQLPIALREAAEQRQNVLADERRRSRLELADPVVAARRAARALQTAERDQSAEALAGAEPRFLIARPD